MAPNRKSRGKRKELIGWLEMPKADKSGTVLISVYRQRGLVLLQRFDHFFYEHPVHPAAKGWTDEAATVWHDLQMEGSRFRSITEGLPSKT
jgi:hypothetical protein